MRTPIIAGNWKMNKGPGEAAALIRGLRPLVEGAKATVVLCVPAVDLQSAHQALRGSSIKLGAQNVHHMPSGAFTGELSVAMLKEAGAQYVIIGHSERRQYFGETDAIVNRKTQAALASSLHPIVCVGETLQEREAGKVEEVITTQVQGSLAGLSAKELLDSVIAYEPVWAIGTGKTATPQYANQVIRDDVRGALAGLYGAEVASHVTVQYGRSVNAANALELLSQSDIDGALVGGASLKAADFVKIVQAAVEAKG